MNALEFRQAGETLFGADGWQMCLAKLLSTNIRTVQRWASGQNEIPADVGPVLSKLIETSAPIRDRNA